MRWPFRYPHLRPWGFVARLPGTRATYPILFEASWAHWDGRPGGGCSHGPCSTSWPFGKLIAFNPCKLGPPGWHGLRLWIYTRWGALYLDAWVDRRVLRDVDAADRATPAVLAPVLAFIAGALMGRLL